MGLEQVVQEVADGAERRAQEILAAAKAEADGFIADAQKQVDEYKAQRLAQTERDEAQIKRQALSHAEFEGRKAVLGADNELRARLRAAILDGMAALDAKTRSKHIDALVANAQGIIANGKVFGAAQDADALKAVKAYSHGGDVGIAGGIVVESEDGTERLDLSYETLVQDAWKDILAAEAGLFA